MYKLGELNALSIYWNSDVKSRAELSQESIIDKLQAQIVKNESTEPDHMTYILRPLNINVKLKIAATPREQDYARPAFDARIDLDHISLNINRNQIKKKKAEKKEKSWWDTLTSWWSGDSNKENPEFDFDSATATEEKQKLYDAIGYAEGDTSLAYPAEYVDIDLSIRLNMLEINVWSNINENDSQFKVITSAAVPDVGLIFKRRPTKSDFLLVIDLGSFEIFGIDADAIQIEKLNDIRPVLAKPANKIELEQKNLLHIEYETNPLDRPFENRIQVILHWKIDAQVSAIDAQLSDAHIFGVIKLFQSIPFPESKEEPVETEMLAEIHLLIEESLSDSSNDYQPFVRISFLSIAARATMKTFNIDFNASLADFIIVHEQFITTNNDRLCLIAMERLHNRENDKLISINGLLTSSANPKFTSAPYNSLENQIHVHIGKSVLMLQLEALLSIIRFKNDLMGKISKEQHNLPDQRMAKERAASKPKPKQVVKKDPASVMPTFQLEVDLKGLRAIIGLEFFQILDIQSQGLRVHILNSAEKTSAQLILTDLRVFDPNPKARYRHIISQRSVDNQLLRIGFTLFNYPKNYERTFDDVDCDVKIQLTKVNIALLYKHVDLILNLVNAFQTKKTERNASSNQPSAISEAMENFQKQARKLRLDVAFDAPSIFIPTSSYSNEGIFINLGQLTIQTHFTGDPNCSLVEQQIVVMNNLFASRVKLGKNNETLGDIVLLKCAELSTSIDRLLYSENIQHESQISIIANWDTIQFTLAKNDYACMMKVFKGNFSEKIYHKISKSVVEEQPEYRQTSQNLVMVTNKNQHNFNSNKVSEKIHLNAEIKMIAITLYLGESNVTTRHASRNESSKFLDLRLEMLKAHFRQLSDSSYDGKAEIQKLLLEDLRKTNGSTGVSRMIDRSFNVDPNVPMFTVTLKFKTKNEQQSMDVRQVKVQLESFYICMSPDYFMALHDFFISSLSLNDEKKPHSTIMYSETPSDVDYDLPLPAKPTSTFRRSSRSFSGVSGSTSQSPKRMSETPSAFQDESSEADGYLYTKIKVVINTPKIILLEDQHDNNSNCLVLDVSEKKKRILKEQSLCEYGICSVCHSDTHGHYFATSRYRCHFDDELRTAKNRCTHWGYYCSNPSGGNYEEKQELIEQMDVLELTTGTPSHKKAAIEEANKQKEKEEKIQTQKILSQELILNLKIIEIKLELGTGSSTKPVIAMCLSNLLVDVKNWSSDISISSEIHVELALFNDNLLAWEPLIEPVINESGEVVCPWCITCSTSNSRFLLDDPKSSSNTKEQQKDGTKSLNAKQVIYVRADHLLNVTVTKTMLNLAQHLYTMFQDAYNKRSPSNEDDDRSLLSIYNMTGCDVYIDNISDVEFLEDKKLDTPIHLKHHDSIPLTVPGERLSATRIPAISEQIANRTQEFSVKIGYEVKKVDINQTWRRVFKLGPSPIPNWPVQLLCDSQIYNDRRRIVLSSIIKMFNRATMPVMILDIDSVEIGTYREVARIEANGELYLPIELLYVRMNPRLFISIDEAKSTDGVQDFISFDWEIESSADRVLKMKNGKDANIVFYKESKEAYSENTDEPIRTSFHIYVKLALHLINLLSVDVECWIDISGHNRGGTKDIQKYYYIIYVISNQQSIHKWNNLR
ncbi:unnamed protein product [Rotaria sp. Silwood2]|nr:unnamed protein product [Rotaria sp. Silwood2]